jgi:anthranilate phosphoribosyltransferase
LNRLLAGEALGRDEADAWMEAVLAEAVPDVQVAATLAALRHRGETTHEVLGFFDALMRHAVRLPVSCDTLIDTCGTGGDGLGTFNISTASAVVVAACGVPVAKHGNRSVSSKSGSSDVLEAAGVPIIADPDRLARCIEDFNLAFLFAPFHHPALKVVGPTRRALGVMTVFNLLGPMANPAPLTHQMVGVPRLAFLEQYAEIYRERSLEALIVHGRDGADEALPGGPMHLARVSSGHAVRTTADPAEYGVPAFDLTDFEGGDAAHNAQLLEALLAGGGPAPLHHAIALNAGLALELTGAAPTIEAGIAEARRCLSSGEPWKLLRAYSARLEEA